MSDRVALLRLVTEIKAYTAVIDRHAGDDYFSTERRRPRMALERALSYAERTIAQGRFGPTQSPLFAALIAGAALAESTVDPEELEEHAYQQRKKAKEETMGRSITLIGQKFTIDASKVSAAFAAVLALRPTEKNSRGRTHDADGSRHCHFAWIRQEALQSATSLSDYVLHWGYTGTEDEYGFRLTGGDVGKLGDEATLFGALAPYADPGSYVEYAEEGTRWRFIVRDGLLHTETAKISWGPG